MLVLGGAWNWPLAIWRARSLTLTNMVMVVMDRWRGSGVDRADRPRTAGRLGLSLAFYECRATFGVAPARQRAVDRHLRRGRWQTGW